MIKMKLLKYDDVVNIIERVTNEAIEKKKNKATLQKMLIVEIDTLDPAKAKLDECTSWKKISTLMGDRYVCIKCNFRVKDTINHLYCPYCGRRVTKLKEI